MPIGAPSARARAARAAGRDDVAGVRAALGHGGLQDRLQRAVEAIELRGGEAVDPRQGRTLACQRISSASRLPTPAILDWLSSRALTAIVPFVISARNSAG